MTRKQNGPPDNQAARVTKDSGGADRYFTYTILRVRVKFSVANR